MMALPDYTATDDVLVCVRTFYEQKSRNDALLVNLSLPLGFVRLNITLKEFLKWKLVSFSVLESAVGNSRCLELLHSPWLHKKTISVQAD